MLATALIAFREFLEAFMIVGVFLGISRKMSLKKEREILFAAGIGIGLSLLLSSLTYLFGDYARGVLTEQNADMLESYLLIFSGFFIAYVVFSLHSILRSGRGNILLKAHTKLQQNAFDLSLFFTIIFLVLREGFEIALFTASTALFAEFMQNFLGLVIGFFASFFMGILTFFAYMKFSIQKIFKATEYMIILLGASLVQNGVTKLFETHFHISLSDMIPLHMSYLPNEDSFSGHLISSLIGVDQEFSLVRLFIMAGYIIFMYFLFLKSKRKSKVTAESN